MPIRDPNPRWRPPSLTASLPWLAATLVAGAGIAILALQPPRFGFRQHPLSASSDVLLPVDALGVSHHDFAYVTHQREVVLERLMYGAKKIVWQTTLRAPARLTGTLDVSGNGQDALCLSTNDGEPAAIVLDHDGQRMVRLSVPEPPRADREPAEPAELVIHQALQREGRRKLLASLERPSANRSEIMLFDLDTGRPEWTLPLTGIPWSATVADLDGDGRPEFLISTGSLRRSGDPRDGPACCAIAIRENGDTLWSVPLAPHAASTAVAVLGRSAANDGARVVVTARPVPGADTAGSTIEVIHGASGRILAVHPRARSPGPPVAVAGNLPRIAVGSRDGTLRIFDADLSLVAERRFDAPIRVAESGDLDQDGRPELIAATASRVLILDERLRTRAELHLPGPSHDIPDVRLASAGFGHARLAVPGSPALVADVVPIAPLTDPMRLPFVAALALAAGIGVRLRIRGGPARPVGGAEAREFLLDYHQIRHETFGRERPFARVRLWAQAQIAGHPLPAEVLESARDEYRRIGAPTLLRFARRAADLGVARDRVRRVESLSAEIERSLAEVCHERGGGIQAAIERALGTMTALSEECLAAYREVALRDVCRPDHEAQEAILAKRAVLDRRGVALDLHVDPSGKQPVLFDSIELRALVGELIENAAHALEHTAGAEIRLRVAGKPGDARWVVMRIEDNGPGMPSRDRVFAPGGSSHPEGGFGLHRAREIAQRWLADLALEEAEDGHGAVVQLSLRSLLPHDTVATGDVPTHPPLKEDV